MSAKQKWWRDLIDKWTYFDREGIAQRFEKLASDWPEFHGRHTAEVIKQIRNTNIRCYPDISRLLRVASHRDRDEYLLLHPEEALP